MKNRKTYNHGTVNYTFSPANRKWTFCSPDHSYTLLQECPGGAEVAHKVASIVAGSLKRTGYVDSLARHNINRMVGQA